MSTEMWRPDFEDLDWSKHLATEMRFRGASDQEVADALTTAKAHCLDSGQAPEKAMGDPVEMATELVGRRTAPFAYAMRDSLPSALAVCASLSAVNLIGIPLTGRVHPSWAMPVVFLVFWLLSPIVEGLVMRNFPRMKAANAGVISFITIFASVIPALVLVDRIPRMSLPVWAAWVFGAVCITGWVALRLHQLRQGAAALPARDEPGDGRSKYLGVVALPLGFVLTLLISIF